MHPRTLGITCVVLLVGSFGAEFFVERFGLLQLSEEIVLKRAVALGVNYYDGGELKAQYITDPVEVREVLATLRIQDKEDYNGAYYYSDRAGSGVGTAVEFRFPNGQVRNHRLYGGNTLGSRVVDRAFTQKLAAIISQREGHAIDLSRWQPSGGPNAPKQKDR